jgi:F-type H+-transporting ATPase subunit gamma
MRYCRSPRSRRRRELTERLAALERRIASVRQLEAVVTAMRGIALSRAQQSKVQLAGVRAYAGIIAEAIGRALPLLDDGIASATGRGGKPALILFCAEQGFAGAFGDRILDEAEALLTGADVLLIGSRGLMLAEQRHIVPAWHTGVAPHIDSLPVVANRIADALYSRIARAAPTRVDAIFPEWSETSGRMAVQTRRLLPFDYARFSPQPRAVAPLTTLPADVLMTRLSEEYVFAEICEMATIAFAAENEARVAAMVGAKKNIKRTRGSLESVGRQVRQDEVTSELMELSASVIP